MESAAGELVDAVPAGLLQRPLRQKQSACVNAGRPRGDFEPADARWNTADTKIKFILPSSRKNTGTWHGFCCILKRKSNLTDPSAHEPGKEFAMLLSAPTPHRRTPPLSALARFLRDEDGATLVEYVLLVALIALLCAGAIALLGTSANSKLNSAAASLQ